MENLKEVENYFNFKLTDEWGLQNFYIYEESTADGYSVYIATDNNENINVSEDVYYYDSDLKDALVEYIDYYIDDLEAYFVEEAIQELTEIMEKQIEEARND
jgi:hypothetical protein